MMQWPVNLCVCRNRQITHFKNATTIKSPRDIKASFGSNDLDAYTPTTNSLVLSGFFGWNFSTTYKGLSSQFQQVIKSKWIIQRNDLEGRGYVVEYLEQNMTDRTSSLTPSSRLL